MLSFTNRTEPSPILTDPSAIATCIPLVGELSPPLTDPPDFLAGRLRVTRRRVFWFDDFLFVRDM